MVDVLEERYGAFDGLNLCFETREGILKHCRQKECKKLGDVGKRFLIEISDRHWKHNWPILPMKSPTTTTTWTMACVPACITLEQLAEVKIFARHLSMAKSHYPDIIGTACDS